MNPQLPRQGACPACKYQRRRCGSDCIFALHFPDDPVVYADIDKLFGRATTERMFQQAEPEFQEDLVKSVCWEARMWRRRSPFIGCLGYINWLQEQITKTSIELAAVRRWIEVMRRQQHQQHQNLHANQQHAPPHAGGNDDQ